MRTTILIWILGLSWLGIGLFFLRASYHGAYPHMWQTILSYILGGMVFVGGMVFTLLAPLPNISHRKKMR